MIQQFSSKLDSWVTVVVFAAVAAIAGTSISSTLQARWLIATVLVLSAAAILWVFYGTRYTPTESGLVGQPGPLRWKVDLAGITSVAPTNGPAG